MEQQLQDIYNHVSMGEMTLDAFRVAVQQLMAEEAAKETGEFLSLLCPAQAEA